MMDSERIANYLLVSAIILFILVFIKWLKRYLHRKEIKQKFAFVYPYLKVQSGDFILKIELPLKGELTIYVSSMNGEILKEIKSGPLTKGEHSFIINTTEMANGKYDLIIHAPYQKISRTFEVLNKA